VIYPAPDLAAAKAWFTELLQTEPYFDQPFYVGFDVGGYELGLDPSLPAGEGPTTYWGVANADLGLAHLLDKGATVISPVQDVGEGIRVARVETPDGFTFGVIENPNFKAK
jgi:predicted enzyme related to lactoylglutathione lyase